MSSNCHPLNSLCLFLSVIETYLYRKSFISPVLNDVNVLGKDTVIKYVDACDDIKNDSSYPVVAYSIGDTALTRSRKNGLNVMDNSVITECNVTVSFKVSTMSKTLTRELAFELSCLTMSLIKVMQPHNLYIVSASAQETRKNPENNFYESVVGVALNISAPVLQTEELNSILREIKVKYTVD